MANATSNYMCTTYCPCPTSNSSNNNWFNNWSTTTEEAILNKYNRTSSVKVGYTGFTFSSVGTTYTTFWGCYSNAVKNYNTATYKGYDISSISSETLDWVS